MPSNISEYSPQRQVVLLFGAASLYIAYRMQLFREKAYNDLALIFAVITFLWFLSVLFRYLFYTSQTKDKLEDLPKIKVPKSIKCAVKTAKCKDGDINVWSLIHFIMYIIIGYLVPGHYLAILYISILCELLEAGLGYTSKPILDPIINLLGYALGSAIANYKRRQ